MIPGPTNTLTDVPGIRVGHYSRFGDGWLTGTTVVLAPPSGAVAGVDVRGGGPGTHETDVLDPRNLIERVDAIVLSGGSAYGLASVTGVMARLGDAGTGFLVGRAGQVVPIVPAAVLYDLGRGGAFRATPDAAFGAAAYDAANNGPVGQGTIGAGTGAHTAGGIMGDPAGLGGVKGGVGSASTVLGGSVTVAALTVVNAVGSTVDPRTGSLYGARYALGNEFAGLRDPEPAELIAARHRALTAAKAEPATQPFNTTLGVIATDATLSKAQCQKLAGVTHDGMARAIRPVHSMFDGDTVFALATCAGPPPDPLAFNALLAVAADTFSRAVAHGMLAASGVAGMRAYGELLPSAVRDWRGR